MEICLLESLRTPHRKHFVIFCRCREKETLPYFLREDLTKVLKDILPSLMNEVLNKFMSNIQTVIYLKK